MSGTPSGLRAAFSSASAIPISDVALCGLASLSFGGSFLVANHYPPWVTAYNDLLSALGLTLLLTLIAHRPTTWKIPSMVRGIALVAALPMLQVATGQILFFGDGWVASLYLLCLAAAVLGGYNAAVAWPQRFVSVMCGLWVTVALLSCLIVLIQRFNIDPGNLGLFIWDVKPGHAPFGNLGQPNLMATFLAFSLAALACLFERGHVGGRWALAAAALIVVCMAMTQSRAALLLLGMSLVLLCVYRTRLKLRTPRLVVLMLVALWGLSFTLLPSLFDWIGGLPTTASVASRLNVGPRTIIWAQLVDAALREPWWGYGWNQVSVAQMQVAADHGASYFSEHSHNLLLDLVLWNGFPIAALLVGVGTWWLVSRMRRVRSVEGMLGLALVVLLLTHSMVEFPLDNLYLLIPFGLAIGVLERDAGAVYRAQWSRRRGQVLVGVAATALLAVAIDYLRFEDKYRDLRLTLAKVGSPLVLASDPSVRTMFTQLAALYDYPLIEVRPGMPAEQIAWMGRVALRHPYVPVLYHRALAQALHGDPAAASLTFKKLKRLHSAKNYADAKAQFEALGRERYPQLKAVALE